MGDVIPMVAEKVDAPVVFSGYNPLSEMMKLMNNSERAALEMLLIPFVMRQKNASEVRSYGIDDLHVGQRAYDERRVASLERDLAALLSKDYNPIHFDEKVAASTRFEKPIVHGIVVQCIFSSLLGTQLPGKGAIYVENGGEFKRPVYFGDTLHSEVHVTAINKISRMIDLEGSAWKYAKGIEQIVYRHRAKIILDPSQG